MIKKVFESVSQAHVVKEQANVVKVKAVRLNCNFLVAILILYDSTFKRPVLQCGLAPPPHALLLSIRLSILPI